MRLMSLSGPRAGGHKTEVPMGGNITIQGNIVTHDYTQTANLSVPITFGGNLLLVGGGGGGGTGIGGGGGAGGLVFNPNEVIPKSYYNVTVGAGGSGATSTTQSGAAGDNTSLNYQNTAQVTVNGAININLANGLHALIWKFDGTQTNFYQGDNSPITQTAGNIIVSGNRFFVNELLLIGGGNAGGWAEKKGTFATGAIPTTGNVGYGGAPGSIFYSNNFFIDPGTYSVGVGKGGKGDYSDTIYVTQSGKQFAITSFYYAQKGGISSLGPYSTPVNPPNYTLPSNAGVKGTSIYNNLLQQINQYLPANKPIGSLINGKYYLAAGGGGARITTNSIGGTGGLGGGGAGATTAGKNSIPGQAADPNSYGSGGGGTVLSANQGEINGNGANGIVIMTYFTSGDVFVAHGGGGGVSSGAVPSSIGGSGGGGGGNATNNFNMGGKSYAVEGNDGGQGVTGLAGGGGGSLGYTNSINAQTTAGSGGQPTPVDITGYRVYYAGGGGGGASAGTAGAGNESGGSGGSNGPGLAGIDNTGGGGGGNGNTDTSGANRGGSGRAVVKYQTWANQGLRNGIFTCKDAQADINGDWYTLTFTKNTYLSLHIPVTAEILVVGAGGEASSIFTAGGGAGGVIYIPQYNLPAGSYQIKVGQPKGFWGPDGFGVPDTTPGRLYEASASGGNSYIKSTNLDINLIALGGGAAVFAWSGISNNLTTPIHPLGIGPVAGGSGGGNANRGLSYIVGSETPGAQPNMPGDSGKYGYGNAGGALDIKTSSQISSGGGGAGSAGQAASLNGNGGDGILLGITGKQTYYAAGGGGTGFLGGGANGAGYGDVGLVNVGGIRYYKVTNQSYGSGGIITSLNRISAAPGVVIIKFNTSNIILGGVKSTIGPYTLHTFRTAAIDGFQNLQDITADILIIGGGGGGGAGAGGGGGAGGYVFQQGVQLPADYYQVKVGAGGLGGNPNSTGNTYNGNNGEDSYLSGNFVTIYAKGGGGGVGATGFSAGLQGGSGGGGSVNAANTVLPPGIGNASQGFAGGAGISTVVDKNSNVTMIVGGGGGGAAQAGASAKITTNGGIVTSGTLRGYLSAGSGGSGITNDITGVATYYAGGGGGGSSVLVDAVGSTLTPVLTIEGGAGTYTNGGGGPGYSITYNQYKLNQPPTASVLDGLPNTGGGGGGGLSITRRDTITQTGTITNSKAGGKGGSGLVIIRYLTAQPYIAPTLPPAPVTPITGATGGVKTSANGYIYHTFYTSGTFIPAVTGTVDMLIVAGGGSGGVYYYGGGGGAGGVITLSNFALTGSIIYTVTVGQGGVSGSNGDDSIVAGSDITTQVAKGGGAGTNGFGTGLGPGKTGGSGGGGGAYGGNAGGTATTGQGNNGGQGGSISNGDYGGGGGGAGTAGNSGALPLPRAAPLGQGGDGIIWLNGIAYAGGGGGALDLNAGDLSYFAAGGLGGGGSGANYSSHPAADGTPNTGGGGGGACHALGNPTPGKGGSGVVIIRYPGTL